MTRAVQVGVTGGIGAGKTTICKIFETLGVPVYYADDRAKVLMNEDRQVRQQVIKLFGKQAYNDSGSLNRAFLAREVFHSEEKTRLLNGVVHPAVGRDYENWLNALPQNQYVLREAALLVETGIYLQLDYLITVTASIEERIKRVLKRDPLRNREQVEYILARQVSEEERQSKSHFIIKNNGDELVIPQVLAIHEKITGKVSFRGA